MAKWRIYANSIANHPDNITNNEICELFNTDTEAKAFVLELHSMSTYFIWVISASEIHPHIEYGPSESFKWANN